MLSKVQILRQTVSVRCDATQMPVLPLLLLSLCRSAINSDSLDNHQLGSDHIPAPC